MINFRKVPTKKLMQRLDVLRFKDVGPITSLTFNPKIVRIPLMQHVGMPAKPIVEKDDFVKRYDLIAEADGEISAHVHASISGRIINVNKKDIVIQGS
jgi:Na+-translocating ferredoxin:NAD+ oxidoreductase RnfC subunit